MVLLSIMEKKSKTYRSIVAKINRHISEHSLLNPDYSKWYVGVTNSPKRRRMEHDAEFGFGIQYYNVFYAFTLILGLFSKSQINTHVSSR